MTRGSRAATRAALAVGLAGLLVAPAGVASKSALNGWVEQGTEFAKTLPPK